MDEGSSSHEQKPDVGVQFSEEPVVMDTGSTHIETGNQDEQPASMIAPDTPSFFPNIVAGDHHDPQYLMNEVRRLETEKAVAERGFHNVNTELNDLKAKNQTLVEKSKSLEEHVVILNKESRDRQLLYQKLEDSRNEFANRIIAIETELNKTKSENQDNISKWQTVSRDLQGVLTENVACKEELKRVTIEKTKLAHELEALQQDTRKIAVVKEWRKMDTELYEESRKWFTKEIADRDNKLSHINLEIRAKELQWKNDELGLTQQLKKVQADLLALEEKLNVKQEALERVTANIEQQASKSRLEIKNLEAELKVKEQQVEFYKSNFEEAEKMVEDLGEKLTAQNELLRQTKEILEEVRVEREDERAELQRQIEQRDNELFDLRDEVHKLNELLRSKHAVSLNVTEDELAQLSPAAAETSRFIKSGSSLTSLVRDHARLAGELASEKEKSKQLEDALNEIVRDLEENMPQFAGQREQLNQVFDENSRLKEQLQSAEDQRQSVESNRDGALRELAFTKAELEKYQRECSSSSKKIQRLLFVLETSNRGPDSPPLSQEDESHLFNNIAQLQKINVQLEAELQAERSSAASRHITAQNSELLVLKQELEASRETERQLSEQLEQINVAFESIREQNAKLMELNKSETIVEQLRELKLKYNTVLADLETTRLANVRLETLVCNIQQEKTSIQQIFETRLSNSQSLIDELKAFNAKLETKFEYQNQIAETNAKELEHIQKEIQRVQKENDEFKRADDVNANKITELHQQIIKMHDEYSGVKIENTINADELRRSKADVARLEAQLEVFQSRLVSDRTLQDSILELHSQMDRIKQEKRDRTSTQLELVSVERDNMKREVARVQEDLRHSREETKLVKNRFDAEVALLMRKLGEKEESYKIAETALYELKLKLEKMQSTSSDQTDEMSPERLRKECQQLTNRAKFMESQLEDAKVQLEAARAEAERNKSETQRMESHSGRLETGLKDAQIMASLETQRLQNRAEDAELRANSLAEEVAQLQRQVSDLQNEFDQYRLQAVKENGELTIELQVSQKRNEDAMSRLAHQSEQMLAFNAEKTARDAERDMMQKQLSDGELRLFEARSQIEQLNMKLHANQQQCLIAEENVRVALEEKKTAEKSLELRTQQAIQDETNFHASLAAQEGKLQELITNYKELVVKMGPATDTSASELLGEEVMDFDLPQATIQSLEGVIAYLRQERDAALTRTMNAEVEVKRLRAEVKETFESRDDMICKIRRLELAAATADQLTKEKADLMKKLDLLSLSQAQYQRARADADMYGKQKDEYFALLQEAEKQAADLQSQLRETTLKVTALTAEVEKKGKEMEVLKGQIQRQVRPANQASAVHVQKLTEQLQQVRGESEKSAQQIPKLEQEKADILAKFEQARTLARKYRDELNAYKKAHPENGAPASSSAILPDAEKEKLKKDIEHKTNEIQEASFRLNLLSSKCSSLEEQKKEWQNKLDDRESRIQNLERMLQSKGISSASVTPVSSSVQPSVFAASSSHPSGQESVAEEPEASIAMTETVSPPDAGLHLEMENVEAEAAPSQQATSSTTRSSIFGRSAAPSYSLNEPVVEHDLVSESNMSLEPADELQNDSESRDSNNMPVSSTGGTRKRPAAQSSSQTEIKRQRETSNEAVSSTEERPITQREQERDDDTEFIPDPVHAVQPDDNDDDIIPLDPPNQANYYEVEEDVGEGDDDGIQQIDEEEEDDENEDEEEDMNDEFEVPDSDEGASEMDNADDSEDSGEEEGDVHPPQMVDGSEDDDAGDANGDQDVEVVGADDNSRSQPFIDDQDREAASAVEEADDEGRVSADGGNEAVQAPAPSHAPRRAPITFERDDQCSSSNETGSTTAAQRQAMTLRRQTARPTRGVYAPKRGVRGARGKK